MNIVQVEKRLAARLEAGLEAWNKCLLGEKEEDKDKINEDDTDAPQQPSHKPGGEPKIKVTFKQDNKKYSMIETQNISNHKNYKLFG